jgi:hypothetical protein
MFGTEQRPGLADSPLTEDMYSSIEIGINKAETRKTRKRPTNRIEKIKMKIKPMALQKKQDKKVYCMICEKESSGAYKCSVCDQFFHAVCGGYRLCSEGFRQNITCNLCVRKNRINIQREGAKSGQK